jgi:hypothetical protein
VTAAAVAPHARHAYERQNNRDMRRWLQQPERVERRIGSDTAQRCEK